MQTLFYLLLLSLLSIELAVAGQFNDPDDCYKKALDGQAFPCKTSECMEMRARRLFQVQAYGCFHDYLKPYLEQRVEPGDEQLLALEEIGKVPRPELSSEQFEVVLPITYSPSGEIVVLGMVDGQSIKLVVDTGATQPVYLPAADYFGLEVFEHYKTVAYHLNSVKKYPAAVLDNLMLGGVRVRNLVATIDRSADHFKGVIGIGVLRLFDEVVFDLKRDTLTLKKNAIEESDYRLCQPTYINADGLLSSKFIWGGKAIPFGIDTGSFGPEQAIVSDRYASDSDSIGHLYITDSAGVARKASLHEASFDGPWGLEKIRYLVQSLGASPAAAYNYITLSYFKGHRFALRFGSDEICFGD